jgi:hypothetical protein
MGVVGPIKGVAMRIFFALTIMFVATADVDNDPWRSESAEKTAAAKRQQILTEIQQLGNHDWTGDYFAGDGLGARLSLLIAPASGYLFEWHGCLRLYNRNYGAVTSKDGRLRLSFTFENKREGFQGIAPELVPVRWGTRRYLVPADDLVGFCNDVNSGSEPRDWLVGSYFLRRGDEKKMVRGRPDIPQEYRSYVLAKPINATILTVGTSTLQTSRADWKFKDTPLTLDAGSKQGLKVGMRLEVTEPDLVFESVRITKVEDNRAEAMMSQTGEEKPGPKVGWKLSTRSPWRLPLNQ